MTSKPWSTRDILNYACTVYRLDLDAATEANVMRAIRRHAEQAGASKTDGKHLRIPAAKARMLVEADMRSYFLDFATKQIQKQFALKEDIARFIDRLEERTEVVVHEEDGSSHSARVRTGAFAEMMGELEASAANGNYEPSGIEVMLAEVKAMLSALLQMSGKRFDNERFEEDYRERYRQWLKTYDVETDQFDEAAMLREHVLKERLAKPQEYLEDV